MSKFETDEQGNVILKPVMGWEIRGVAEVAILLAIDYADRQGDIETGNKLTIPLVLTPQKALELAEELRRGASLVLGAGSESRPN